jgi:hypothetical protein
VNKPYWSLLALSAACALAAASTWKYPPPYDAVKAAPKNHRVRYEDAHVRFLEVGIAPGEVENMHGHPYPSVFAYDAPEPGATNVVLDAASPLNGGPRTGGQGAAPTGRSFPMCVTLGPEAPHAVTNTGAFPDHFYRLEFKRVDGEGIWTQWKEWYPWMLKALKPVKDLVPGSGLGKPYSNEWPYPAGYESVKAAPKNHYLRYVDSHVRLIEVVMRPGETENMHGHQYPSVFANDAAFDRTQGTDNFLNPNDPMNNNRQVAHIAPAPAGYPNLTCRAAGPEAPHAATNHGKSPVHFFRIEFKRIDGEELKTRWREWYPWLAR